MVHVVFTLAMILAFVGGLVLIGEATRRRPDHPACRACDYNLTGLPSGADTCPECGQRLTARMIVQPRERWVSTSMLVIGIAMVTLVPFGCCFGSTVLRSVFGPP